MYTMKITLLTASLRALFWSFALAQAYLDLHHYDICPETETVCMLHSIVNLYEHIRPSKGDFSYCPVKIN